VIDEPESPPLLDPSWLCIDVELVEEARTKGSVGFGVARTTHTSVIAHGSRRCGE
jgi:hypothetical protein